MMAKIDARAKEIVGEDRFDFGSGLRDIAPTGGGLQAVAARYVTAGENREQQKLGYALMHAMMVNEADDAAREALSNVALDAGQISSHATLGPWSTYVDAATGQVDTLRLSKLPPGEQAALVGVAERNVASVDKVLGQAGTQLRETLRQRYDLNADGRMTDLPAGQNPFAAAAGERFSDDERAEAERQIAGLALRAGQTPEEAAATGRAYLDELDRLWRERRQAQAFIDAAETVGSFEFGRPRDTREWGALFPPA
jgi:hypothetical protein